MELTTVANTTVSPIEAITAAVATQIGGIVDSRIGPRPVIRFCCYVLIGVCLVIIGMDRESLFGLVAAITVGLFVGTYSSVYLASPILIWLGVTSNSFVPQETAIEKQEKAARDRSRGVV